MVYSESEEIFQELYKKLLLIGTPALLTYFNNHWLGIRDEWTYYSMSKGNLRNYTNNRLESINAKIKQLIKRHPLIPFFKKFFIWLNGLNREMDNRMAQMLLRAPIVRDKNMLSEFIIEAVHNKIKGLPYRKAILLSLAQQIEKEFPGENKVRNSAH